MIQLKTQTTLKKMAIIIISTKTERESQLLSHAAALNDLLSLEFIVYFILNHIYYLFIHIYEICICT